MTWREDQRVAWPMKKLGHAQLGAREGAMLYYLARDWASGARPLVELGSFLGGSASLTGAGLKDNPLWNGQTKLHCFDIFEAKYGNMAEFIRTRVDPDFEAGQNFQYLFDAQTAEVSEAIEVHRGDLMQASWSGGEIDMLFVDIAKTPDLNRITLQRFLPALRVETGLLVNQDFHNPDNPWIHTSLGFLSSHFELIEPRADDSILLRLVRPIPPEALREAGRFEDLPDEEAMNRVNRLMSLLRQNDAEPAMSSWSAPGCRFAPATARRGAPRSRRRWPATARGIPRPISSGSGGQTRCRRWRDPSGLISLT